MGERTRSRKRNRKTLRRRRNRLLLAVFLGLYLAVSLKYRNSFLPNTIIGEIPAAGMKVEEVKEKVSEGISRYQLIIEEREEKEEIISGRDIELRPLFDGTLETILKEQNALLWGFRMFKGREYQQKYMVSCNQEKLENLITNLDCMNPGKIKEPANAYLTYQEGTGLVIVPEQRGSSPDPEQLTDEIKVAVARMEGRISLESLGVYREPEVMADSAELLEKREMWAPYGQVRITYLFGSRQEILDGSTIWGWLSEDENGSAVVDRAKAEEYVQWLAETYNTAYRAKELKTSYGPTVKLTKGHYGWMIDKKAETDRLIELIQSGESQEREPVYLQTALSHDGPDYGDTYVEMNLTAQHLFYYKDGELLIESDFVSGDAAKGWSTPAGAYELTYKQRNATLKGEGYKTPVSYWLPFNGNIGMHDGYWRSDFGGTIYKKKGSHGCVNLPPAVAKTIYENIEAGTPVLCYHLEGTETNATTNVPSGKITTSSGK